MQMNITFRHVDPIDSLKAYAQEKVERVNKYLDRASEAHVVLSVEKHHHQADITIHSGPYMLRGKERSQDMYASIDLAMDKIERQLKKYKEKLKEKHGRDRVHHRHDLVEQMRWRHQVIEHAEEAAEQGPRIIRKNEFLAQPMSIEEAIMHMDLINNDFYVFTNSTTMEMNVVYRRKDHTFGLIEASGVERKSLVG
ncbi:MAG: ribosome-associated translation inhibitor RaiA [Myxococcaceae bacterium]|jgi:putative sigma-54 modulation protein|nr:ribosome-associated translation inhibitor RaiA [Myxococcaceae bacterium]MCA3013354.1 ribosome-associated translation inhibitor RaiA [Myxococcaceae bacterium]